MTALAYILAALGPPLAVWLIANRGYAFLTGAFLFWGLLFAGRSLSGSFGDTLGLHPELFTAWIPALLYSAALVVIRIFLERKQ